MWFLFQAMVIDPFVMLGWYITALLVFLALDLWKSWFDKDIAAQKKRFEAEKAKLEIEQQEQTARAKRFSGVITRSKPRP